MSEFNFPEYRKYSDLKTYFKLVSADQFTELKRIGNYYSISEFKASIHPERMFIHDLLTLNTEFILLSSEQEYEQTKLGWENELVKTVI